ncbi:MAG: hypothetical protein AB1744_02270, partial [Candidatus Zixiibacteriota bacterium]
MKPLSLFVPIAVALILVCGCGPRKRVSEKAVLCRVFDTRVDVNDRRMTVSWKWDCPDLISGYYVYISRKPLVGRYPGPHLPDEIAPFNRIPFPGDTEPGDDTEYFEADGLENGLKYYVSVRVLIPDRS